LNPVNNSIFLPVLEIPDLPVHGDSDKVVPMKDNSAESVRRYREAGGESLVQLIVLESLGHNYLDDFFIARKR
jgi:hypothetical protein